MENSAGTMYRQACSFTTTSHGFKLAKSFSGGSDTIVLDKPEAVGFKLLKYDLIVVY